MVYKTKARGDSTRTGKGGQRMKIVIKMTELDYQDYLRETTRNAVATLKLERKSEELEELAQCVIRAFLNPETGELEKKPGDYACLERAKELAEKILNYQY